MSNQSDHKKPSLDITTLLPEVYQSEVGDGVFKNAFNRHLTKDDTSRVAGFVGTANPSALVDRQIKEADAHRQAFQLAPTMISTVGTQTSTLSFKAFLRQLSLMGIDIDRMDDWAATEQFNWVPPVNVDMLVNYQDYFWKPASANDAPQYFTVENRCNKAQSRVQSYQQVLNIRGDAFVVTSMSFATNTLNIAGRYDDVFSTGFDFYTKDSNNVNFRNKFWTVESSSYDISTNTTAIVVLEPMATSSETAPLQPRVDQLWYVPSTAQMFTWTGSAWVAAAQSYTISISLEEQLTVYQAEANCICNQTSGWDTAAWDDNSSTGTSWTVAWLQGISFNTALQWVATNGQPVNGSQWYNTTTDELLTYSTASNGWEPAQLGLSQLIDRLNGKALWDMTQGCESQRHTQWSDNNRWIHKSQVQSYADVRRAQLPILEYSSRIELNQWSHFNYVWKYRSSTDDAFATSDYRPSRLELEPIKGYFAVSIGGAWYIYLSNNVSQMDVDIDYTSTFTSGYRFRVTDDSLVSQVYTVESSEYRQVSPSEAAHAVIQDTFATVIKLVETTFTSSVTGGGSAHARIEPMRTSRGDGWRGYHVHWVLNDTATTTTATSNASVNPRLQTSLDSEITPVSTSTLSAHFDTGQAFQPANLPIEIGSLHQTVFVGTSPISRIDLLDKFRYQPSLAAVYAAPNTNNLRVYVNDVRQFNTYTEVVGVSTRDVTVIGNVANTTGTVVEYVQAVEFTHPLQPLDQVRIEVGPAALSEMGWSHVPVRTIEDETQFAVAVNNGTQPEYRSMVSIRKIEQVKSITNQYPLFNAYDVVTGEVVDANPLFAFHEDASFYVNTSVDRRISVSTDGKEFEFEQYLVEDDDGQIYGYRQGPVTVEYWFNPTTSVLKAWKNGGWVTKLPVPLALGVVSYVTPTIATIAPAAVDGAVWYHPTTNVLRVRSNNLWTVIPGVLASETDPTITTIWRKDDTAMYVPQYLDKDGNEVTIGSADGDWGIVDQWRYNPQHENKRTVKYSEVVTHFNTFLNSQDKIPGLLNGGVYTMTQEDYNFSRGGTIKEHNNSFDTLVSAVNVTNITPVGVIDFASDEYATNLLMMREAFTKQVVSLLTAHTPDSLVGLSDYVAKQIIASHESNDFIAQIYGDSHAYDESTGAGVRNWVATAPMFGLAPKYRPHLNVFDNQVQLFHHDGHRSAITYPVAEQDRYSRLVCAATDTRGGTVGLVKTTTPPSTFSAFVSEYGFDVRPGAYWYRVGGGVRQLYRLSALTVSATAPSLYDSSGVEIPDGTLYYNFGSGYVFRKAGLAWVQASTTPNDISMLWELVNFVEIIGNLFLTLEQRLYDVTPDAGMVYDFSQLYSTAPKAALYQAAMRKRFDAYIAKTNTQTPFINTTYVAANAFTWNYTSSSITTPPTNKTPKQVACWQALYNHWYGTPYPHVEPWKLQGFGDKPTWWDSEYADVTGARRWVYDHTTTTGMWENIRIGRVPAGRTYPSGVVSTGNAATDGVTLPTYAYFSVNISNTTLAGGYGPDSLLPPYYDTSAIAATMPTVRSLYNLFVTEIGVTDADYAYGDVGPAEWAWMTSSQYPYNNAAVAFVLQPVKFLHAAFGPQFVNVNGLQVETTLNQVYSHQDALFHGDVYNTDQAYKVRGINQWYVNYNRYSGFDTNGEFRALWAGWVPQLTYQFGGIVDTSTVELSSKYYDVIPQDYSIVLANNGVIRDLWIDAFEATLLTIPSAVVQYNNQSQWKIELDSLATNDRTIEYYGVKQYAFDVNTTTGVCTAFQYGVVGASSAAHRFSVMGDETAVFTKDLQFTISGSPVNDGVYTVSSSVFEPSSGTTRINVVETIAGSIAGGSARITTKALPWQTGDEIVITSSKIAPAPLYSDTSYFFIRLSDNTFKLADTQSEAYAGTAIDLTSRGDGIQYVAQVDSAFNVFGGASNSGELWYHFAVDTSDVRTFTPPYVVAGMQNFINIIDGYAARQKDLGVLPNVIDAQDFDPNTGRAINWSLETERFIDWAYGLRQSRISLANSHPVSINTTDNTMAFTTSFPAWTTGTMVAVTSTGSLPTPLQANVPYFAIMTSDASAFKLSMSNDVTDTSSYIDLTSAGSGTVSVSVYERRSTYPKFELNPTRYNAWIDTPLGVLSDVVVGPYTDIRVQQTVFDQYSRPMSPSQLVVYRDDKRSHIAIRRDMANDVDPTYGNDDYNNLHLGGGHFFIESYEHFLVFNNYTVGGALVYDPFLGIQARKFNLDYFEKQDYTLRPTLGGYYLLNGKFYRNLEGSATDTQNYYDTLALSEATDVARRARSILGYRGRQNFLDLLNINSKSQFLFYKGMIQTKGSVNSVNAFINSRRFVDARVDEFWAWKVATYGDARTKIYPEIKLFATDGLLDDVRLNFLGDGELVTDDTAVEAAKNGFELVSFNDSSRWNLSPEQQTAIKSPLFLDATVATTQVMFSGPTRPHPGMEQTVNVWFDTVSKQAYTYNVVQRLWNTPVTDGRVQQSVLDSGGSNTNVVYVQLDQPCDTVRVIRQTATIQQFDILTCANNTITVAGNITDTITVGIPVIVRNTITNDNTYEPSSSYFDGTNTVITVLLSTPNGTSPVTLTNSVGGEILAQDFNSYTTQVFTEGSLTSGYVRVNSEVLRFQQTGFADIIIVYLVNPAASQISPAKLIDGKSNTVVQQLPLWDPARGRHSVIASHNIDLLSGIDPARYQFAPNPTSTTQNFWNTAEVGKVWMDTSHLGYVPYYDDMIYPTVNERLYSWGKLAPWSSVRVYEWVKSTVHPSEWDNLVTKQAANATILQSQKVSGTPRLSVFKRVRQAHNVTSVSVATNTITVAGYPFVDGMQVLFDTSGTMPTGLVANTKYAVVGSGNTVSLIDVVDESEIIISDVGTGQLRMIPAFQSTDWNTQYILRERVCAYQSNHSVNVINNTPTAVVAWPATTTTIAWVPNAPADWVVGLTAESDRVSVYVNSVLVEADLIITPDTVGGTLYYSVTLSSNYQLNEHDLIDVVRPIHTVTDDEASFDPDLEDDGTVMIQWKTDYQYSTTVYSGTTDVTYYHFWVENSTMKSSSDNSSLSVYEIAKQIETIPTSYFVVQSPADSTSTSQIYGYGSSNYGETFGPTSDTQLMKISVMYRQAIIRKVSSYLTDDDRYFVRFTRDLTLRNDLRDNGRNMNLKNVHHEWVMFRRNQIDTIPRKLWDRLTESLMGYTLADSTVRVPSLEYELYDALSGTDTRYGLGENQTFVNRATGLATVLAYLRDPTNDFAPMDINAFFAQYSFDTPENIRIAMNAIYLHFNAKHVNAIWFETLMDALAAKSKYHELMKTSWIALHGIRVLEVGGLFDD